jgi:hypothetical protein
VALEVSVEDVQTILSDVGQDFSSIGATISLSQYLHSRLDPFLYGYKSNATYAFL